MKILWLALCQQRKNYFQPTKRVFHFRGTPADSESLKKLFCCTGWILMSPIFIYMYRTLHIFHVNNTKWWLEMVSQAFSIAKFKIAAAIFQWAVFCSKNQLWSWLKYFMRSLQPKLSLAYPHFACKYWFCNFFHRFFSLGPIFGFFDNVQHFCGYSSIYVHKTYCKWLISIE